MGHTSTLGCWGLTVGILGIIAGGRAIGFAAWNGLDMEAGLVNESEVAFPLSVWALTWGIVAIVAIGAYACDVWRRSNTAAIRPPDWLSWFWTVLMIFIILPWNIVGHIFLLRAWTSVSSASSALYGMSIAALIISWIVCVMVIFFVLKVLFVHNWQIGVSRRYLMDFSAANRGGQPLPLLAEDDRVLPLIMAAMDADSRPARV